MKKKCIGTQVCGPQTCVPMFLFVILPRNLIGNKTYEQTIYLWNSCRWRELHRQSAGNTKTENGLRKWTERHSDFTSKNGKDLSGAESEE